MKRVTITGGLGYVGGRIAAHLCATGMYDLTIATRQRLSAPPAPLQKVKLVRWEPESENSLTALVSSCDCLIHLAACNEIDSEQSPLTAAQVNIVNTLRLLLAAKQQGLKQFIYFSTFHVYGSPLSGTISESHTCRPVHPYSITHKGAEDFVYLARQTSTLNTVVLRLTNSFGPPLWPGVNRWTLLVNDLCRQAVTSGALVLRSDGIAERDFVTLSDVCRCVAQLVEVEKDSLGDGIFNLGSGTSMSIGAMAEFIQDRFRKKAGKELPIHKAAFPNVPAGAPLQTSMRCSIEKLSSIGFVPLNDFADELDAMIDFCKTHFRNQP